MHRGRESGSTRGQMEKVSAHEFHDVSPARLILAWRDARHHCDRWTGLFRLETCELHHLPPLLGFCRDELTKFGGRHRHRRSTEIGEPRLDLGISEGGVNLFVEFLDNLNRRVPRRAYPLPSRGLIAGHEIAYRRAIRQRVLTLGMSP